MANTLAGADWQLFDDNMRVHEGDMLVVLDCYVRERDGCLEFRYVVRSITRAGTRIEHTRRKYAATYKRQRRC